MRSSSQRGGRRGLYVAAVITAVLAVVGVGLVVVGRPRSGPPTPPVAASTSSPTAAAATPDPQQSPRPGAAARRAANGVDLGPILPGSTPITLSIPSIGVRSARLVDLAYTEDGGLEVPSDYDRPGWFSPGPSPGEFGPAVIAGHVDGDERPAVFYRLGALEPGALVDVAREDGTTARFRVDKVERYPKKRFPTAKVYGNTTNRAELRLITCGGSFDARTGHYRDNVVAYAHLLGGRRG